MQIEGHFVQPDRDLESVGREIVGSIVIEFARLDFNLGLCLRVLLANGDLDAVNPRINGMNFVARLDELIAGIRRHFPDNAVCIDDFTKWHVEANRWRALRNAFVHGRWGFLFADRIIVNVAPGMPGPKPLAELRFTESELKQQFVDLQELSHAFSQLRKKWQC